MSAFLRSRRARLTPSDVGLPDDGSRRRTPGLRREELAVSDEATRTILAAL